MTGCAGTGLPSDSSLQEEVGEEAIQSLPSDSRAEGRAGEAVGEDPVAEEQEVSSRVGSDHAEHMPVAEHDAAASERDAESQGIAGDLSSLLMSHVHQ